MTQVTDHLQEAESSSFTAAAVCWELSWCLAQLWLQNASPIVNVIYEADLVMNDGKIV